MLSYSSSTLSSNPRICQESYSTTQQDEHASLRRAASVEDIGTGSEAEDSAQRTTTSTSQQQQTYSPQRDYDQSRNNTNDSNNDENDNMNICELDEDERARSWCTRSDDESCTFQDDDDEIESSLPSDNEASDDDNNLDLDADNESDSNPDNELEDESNTIPFWFSNEEPTHVQQVVKEYTKFLHVEEPKCCRQLPTFVGRIERQPVEIQDDDEDLSNPRDRSNVVVDGHFTTLDVVIVYRRDQRQVGSTVTPVHESIILTTWDEDGVPLRFCQRPEADLRNWQRYHRVADPSFIYCLPVWSNDEEFSFEVCSARKEVGYSKEPFNFTKYIPLHYQPQIESASG